MMEAHDARLQAELLLAHALEVSRATMLARLSENISPDAAARYAVTSRGAYRHSRWRTSWGIRNFWARFCCRSASADSAPRNRNTCQLALERARKIALPAIVDVGTGSGALALTLAYHLPNARVVAIDQSRDALDVARLNAKRLNLESRIEFFKVIC